MKRKIIGISLIILAIFASFVNFYTTNFILGDVSNLTFGIGNRPYYIFASLPGFNFSLILVLLTIFFVRYLRHPEYIKPMTRTYMIIAMAFSFIGLVSAILAGALVYKTFTASNPFPGYLIISIVIFSLILIAGVLFFVFCYNKHLKDPENKRKFKAGYIVYTIFFAITIFYAYNRFGALLWSFSYCDVPTLYKTWPFYVSLILPIAILVHTVLYTFKFYKKHSVAGLSIIWTITSLFVVSVVYTLCVGALDSEFISVISPAMGASRLLAKPIDIAAHFVVFGILDVYAIIHSTKYYKKHKPVLARDVEDLQLAPVEEVKTPEVISPITEKEEVKVEKKETSRNSTKKPSNNKTSSKKSTSTVKKTTKKSIPEE